MLSTHLAELYQVTPRALVQAVKRNIERFPGDFMFQLSVEELANLKSQLVTSSWGGLRRAAPYAFTEQGVAMLASVLRSERAIHVSIEIMRTFVRLRQMLASHVALARKLTLLESKCDVQFQSRVRRHSRAHGSGRHEEEAADWFRERPMIVSSPVPRQQHAT